MQVAARLKYARISPQKCRLIADAVRGNNVAQALRILTHMPQKASNIVKKVLESAIANAEHNYGADIDELRVTAVYVDDAPVLRRWKPRARGRVNRFVKRNSHITVQVGDD